jgi:hypothetical protein
MRYNEIYMFDIGSGVRGDRGCGRRPKGTGGQLQTSQREDGRPCLEGLPSSLWEKLLAGDVDTKRALWLGGKIPA